MFARVLVGGIVEQRQARLGLRTLTSSALSYLESGTAAGKAEFPFSPVVRVDYPAFEDGFEMPDLGGPRDWWTGVRSRDGAARPQRVDKRRQSGTLTSCK